MTRCEFVLNSRGKPPDYNAISGGVGQEKIADAEIVFDDGPLAGNRLTGFVVWRGPSGSLYVSPPERTIVSGEFKGATYALLRPVVAPDTVFRPRMELPLKAFILAAFSDWLDK